MSDGLSGFNLREPDLTVAGFANQGLVVKVHRGRDLGQAADLAFIPSIDLFEDPAGLRIDDYVCGARLDGSRQQQIA